MLLNVFYLVKLYDVEPNFCWDDSNAIIQKFLFVKCFDYVVAIFNPRTFKYYEKVTQIIPNHLANF